MLARIVHLARDQRSRFGLRRNPGGYGRSGGLLGWKALGIWHGGPPTRMGSEGRRLPRAPSDQGRLVLFTRTTQSSLGWLGAKAIKASVGRGRPGAVLENVVLGFDVPTTEIGFPSGHTVLVFTLATVFAAVLARRWQITAYVIAILVGLTRIYVGAHLPLDVVGGAGYGIAIGTVAIITSRALTRLQTAESATGTAPS